MTKTASGTTTIEAQYGYEPYGIGTKLQGSQDADFQYAGYYMHAPSGVNLPVFRAYSSSLGRFINRDPIGERGGVNLYGYGAGNPINFVDPLGLYDVFVAWHPIRDNAGAPMSVGGMRYYHASLLVMDDNFNVMESYTGAGIAGCATHSGGSLELHRHGEMSLEAYSNKYDAAFYQRVSPGKGQTTAQLINNLRGQAYLYSNIQLPYNFVGYMGWNSNSLASTLLLNSGANVPFNGPSMNAPGWGLYVPAPTGR